MKNSVSITTTYPRVHKVPTEKTPGSCTQDTRQEGRRGGERAVTPVHLLGSSVLTGLPPSYTVTTGSVVLTFPDSRTPRSPNHLLPSVETSVDTQPLSLTTSRHRTCKTSYSRQQGRLTLRTGVPYVPHPSTTTYGGRGGVW